MATAPVLPGTPLHGELPETPSKRGGTHRRRSSAHLGNLQSRVRPLGIRLIRHRLARLLYNLVSVDTNYPGMDEVLDCCTWLSGASPDAAITRICRRIICRASRVQTVRYTIVQASGIGVVTSAGITLNDPETCLIAAVVLCNVSFSKSARPKMLERQCLPTILELIRVHADPNPDASRTIGQQGELAPRIVALMSNVARLVVLCLCLKALVNLSLIEAGRKAIVEYDMVKTLSRIAVMKEFLGEDEDEEEEEEGEEDDDEDEGSDEDEEDGLPKIMGTFMVQKSLRNVQNRKVARRANKKKRKAGADEETRKVTSLCQRSCVGALLNLSTDPTTVVDCCEMVR